jgi:hypothetical protein
MPDIVEGYITVPEAARGLKRSTEQIRTQWKQLNVNLNAGTVVRDLRDDES